jgi:hypothetical protein
VTHDRGGSSAHALKRQFQQRGCCRCVSDRGIAGAADRLPMRLYVRRWINEWDLRRLYPGEHIKFLGEHVELRSGQDVT